MAIANTTTFYDLDAVVVRPAYVGPVIPSQTGVMFAWQGHYRTRWATQAHEKQYTNFVDSTLVLIYSSIGYGSYIPPNHESRQNLRHGSGRMVLFGKLRYLGWKLYIFAHLLIPFSY